jgi:enterochelin esterase-like enzyme
MLPWKNPAFILRSLWSKKKPPTLHHLTFQSVALEKDVRVDVYAPPDYNHDYAHPFVVFNDGQDLPRMNFSGILDSLYAHSALPPFLVIGIHASDERQREYGTARQADYKNRGDKAAHYTRFILEELLPMLYRHYNLTDLPTQRAIAGFSLGGLSAFDTGWGHPQVFGNIGVFSGALWWRSSPVRPENPDADRIIHDIVRQTPSSEANQRFWFQCGTLDETDDRNNNGIIDAIDDTHDLMAELVQKGVQQASVRYLEIKDGQHNPETWGEAMPDFLKWAFNP